MTTFGLPYVARPKRKVLIFGSRSFSDYQLLKRKMDVFTFKFESCVVVVGCKPSVGGPVNGGFFKTEADRLGERWGHANRHLVICFKPGAEKDMLAFVASEPKGVAVAFDDGRCKRTTALIGACRAAGIPLRVVRF